MFGKHAVVSTLTVVAAAVTAVVAWAGPTSTQVPAS